jgi:hypothetical protein
MSILIQQVFIDTGHLSHREDDYDTFFIKNIAIPSVQEYARLHGYDYNLIEDGLTSSLKSLPNNIIFNKMPFVFEKFMHLNVECDNVLLLDSDIFVTKDTPALPIVSGVAGASPSIDRIQRNTNCKNRCILFNAGFILFTKNVAMQFSKYVKEMVNNWQDYPDFVNGVYHDEEMLMHFLDENQDIPFDYLGDTWNYTGVDWHNHIPEKYMYHFSGPRKHSRYRRLS